MLRPSAGRVWIMASPRAKMFLCGVAYPEGKECDAGTEIRAIFAYIALDAARLLLLTRRRASIYATIIIKRPILKTDGRATPPHRQNLLSVAHLGNGL